MSALATPALTDPARRPGPGPGRPPLRQVPGAATRPSGVGFVVTCAGALAVTLLALLGLNVAISENAFTVETLESRDELLDDRTATLRLQVAEAAAPQRLDSRARALGMVAMDNPTVLSLPAEPAEPADQVAEDGSRSSP